MQAKKYRHIQNGEKFNALFPDAAGTIATIKTGASVDDTVKFIPKVVQQTLFQTKAIAEKLKDNSLEDTCRNIWDFVYQHIRYEKDAQGYEQVRSPARTWRDRFKGVDCDCYTTFISSILSNLRIPHTLRIAKYQRDYFQHIYPIVPTENGKYITIDCVVDNFNYEELFTEKKDFKMDLQYLSGINGIGDAGDQTGNLGARYKAKPKETAPNKNVKPLQTVKKGLHIVNKLNPATALLRNGVLIAMRLNMFKVAQRLKWAYLSEADAQKRGLDLNKWKKLVQVKDKLENIHFTAGGKKEDFKKAILTGKGNKNKEVSGLNGLDGEIILELDEVTPLPQLLGDSIYESEKESIIGLEGLGEPVTAAAITAATGAIAAIAGLLKNIGNILPPKAKGSEDFQNVDETTPDNSSITLPSSSKPFPTSATQAEAALPLPPATSLPETASAQQGSGNPTNTEGTKVGFWEKNKSWLKPSLIGVGVLGIIAGVYQMVKEKKQEAPKNSLSGVGRKKRKSKGKKGNDKDGFKTIELM